MTEVYPSDSELLNIVSENETGVEYIPTGTSPYYLHFRKLLYRLLLATRRANDLRVFNEGGLDIGVKSGKYWGGSDFVEYTGSSGNTLADNKSSIYVYLDSLGNLITTEYSSFPSMASTAHVRLAIVITSGGEITSITDCRDYHSISIPGSSGGGGSGSIYVSIEDHTADDTLTEAESGSVHTNNGATDHITLTLPSSPTAGTHYYFAVQQAAEQIRVDPGDAAIRCDSGQTAGKYKWADAIGECMHIVADSNGNWVVVSKRGTWIEET
jgi:hypothetical protein